MAKPIITSAAILSFTCYTTIKLLPSIFYRTRGQPTKNPQIEANSQSKSVYELRQHVQRSAEGLIKLREAERRGISVEEYERFIRRTNIISKVTKSMLIRPVKLALFPVKIVLYPVKKTLALPEKIIHHIIFPEKFAGKPVTVGIATVLLQENLIGLRNSTKNLNTFILKYNQKDTSSLDFQFIDDNEFTNNYSLPINKIENAKQQKLMQIKNANVQSTILESVPNIFRTTNFVILLFLIIIYFC